MLIEAGADRDALNRDGQTVLHVAIAEEHSNVAVFLIRHLTDEAPTVLTVGDQLGRNTALHLAALKGREVEIANMLDALNRTGGETAPLNSLGHNPLHCAVMNQRDDVAAVSLLCREYAEHKPHLLAPKYLDATSPRDLAEAIGRPDFVRELAAHR